MVKIRLKWKGQIYNDVEVDINSSAREFKKTVRNITGISERDQQLVAHGVWQGNLKDEADLSSLSLTDRQTIMLMSGGAVGASQSTSTKIQVTAAPAPPPPPQTPILPVAWAVAPLASSASVQPARNGTQARPATHYSPLPILIRSEEQYSFQVDPRLLKIAAPITMYLLAVGLALPMPVLLVNNDAVLWYRLGGAFCTAVALPMMGAYSDKDGRRYTALWCLGAAFFQYLVLGLNPDGGGFAFQLAHLVGPMSSGVIAMGFAAAADVIAEQRRGWGGSTLAAEFALLSAAAGLAFTLGPFLSARMMAVSATTVYWAVCCPLCGLGWFLAFKFWEETNPHTDQSFFFNGTITLRSKHFSKPACTFASFCSVFSTRSKCASPPFGSCFRCTPTADVARVWFSGWHAGRDTKQPPHLLLLYSVHPRVPASEPFCSKPCAHTKPTCSYLASVSGHFNVPTWSTGWYLDARNWV